MKRFALACLLVACGDDGAPPTGTPFLALACADGSMPAVRLAAVGQALGLPANACGNLGDELDNIAMAARKLLGDPCIEVAVSGAQCEAVDQTSTGERVLPPCNAGPQSTNKPCFELILDPANCPKAEHLRLLTQRIEAPAADTVITLRCLL